MATENAYPPKTALVPAFKEGAAAAEAAPTAAIATQASAANAISFATARWFGLVLSLTGPPAGRCSSRFRGYVA